MRPKLHKKDRKKMPGAWEIAKRQTLSEVPSVMKKERQLWLRVTKDDMIDPGRYWRCEHPGRTEQRRLGGARRSRGTAQH